MVQSSSLRSACTAGAAAAAPNATHVDVGLWAGLVPANAHDPAALRAMIKGGALGFKAFMSPSGGFRQGWGCMGGVAG